MPNSHSAIVLRDRTLLALIGGVAGVAAWVLVDILPDRVENERLLLFLVATTGGFFAAFLAATGPLSFLRAAFAAAVAALPAAGLLTWASLRHDAVDDFLATLHPMLAFGLIVMISLPFLIAAQREGEGWHNYPALFTQSWNIVVRYAAAWLFVAVFWGVVFLSDALFGLVGLDIIEELLEIDPVPFVLTGAVLGLALAVVVELSDYVSPFLILRLLRLLIPVVLVVTAVFLVALPFRGLSDLFGGFSAAATLLAMAIGIATLISSALDRSDAEAAEAWVLRISSQLLSLAMPVLAGLALHAVWLRVQDHGWTPDRIAAACAALVALGYGVSYALAVLLRRNWMQRVRQANIAMALVVIAMSAVWLSPLLNPERLSAASQVARFARGDVSADRLDLWFIRHELGRAGPDAIDKLKALDHPDAEALRSRIAALEEAGSRHGFEAPAGEDARELIARITEQAVVLPEGSVLPDDAFEAVFASQLRDWAEGCARQTPLGNPGCVLVVTDFVVTRPGDEALLFWLRDAGTAVIDVVFPGEPTAGFAGPVYLGGSGEFDITPATLDALQTGSFSIEPAEIMSLSVGTARIILRP